MTAEITAQRVLGWAAKLSGPLPDGPLWDTGQLARPQAATLELVRDLAAATAATMGAGVPAFGDQNPIGAGTVLLAAAVGGRGQPGPARRLAEALPASRPARTRPAEACWWDLIARHGLVAAVLAASPARDPRDGDGGGARAAEGEPLTETLLRASPLSAVLHRPALGRLSAATTGDEVEAAAALAAAPRGLAALTAALAAWSPLPAVLRWRVELLDRLGRDHPGLVLDTYTLARLRHGEDWDARLRWARTQLNRSGPADRLAIDTVAFWAPLARLRQRGVTLPDVRPLLAGYGPALELVRYHRLAMAGAS